MVDEELYEMLKGYYDILEVDENVDEKRLKRAYRFAVKKYHPDNNPNDKEAAAKFKKVSEAFIVLNDEKNRKIFSKLKERYNKNKEQSKRRQTKSKVNQEETVNESTNKYIFQRRDGSKVEIQPLNRYFINEQRIYKYRVIQYYNNMTVINDVYGRINLAELLKTVEYCDFCVNNLLSRKKIEESESRYNSYIGYVEMTSKNGIKHYRICDRESVENYDMAMEVYNLKNKEDGINIEAEDDNYWLEKLGKTIVKDKVLNQYLIFLDDISKVDIIYSENIDFKEVKNNKKYHKAISKKLLNENRLKSKIEEGGYIGQLLYNVEKDNYDIIMDTEVEKLINVKQNNKKR